MAVPGIPFETVRTRSSSVGILPIGVERSLTAGGEVARLREQQIRSGALAVALRPMTHGAIALVDGFPVDELCAPG